MIAPNRIFFGFLILFSTFFVSSVWAHHASAASLFATSTLYTTGATACGAVATDFNADGKTDFATSNCGDSNVSLFLNNGDGTFPAATNFSVGANPFEMATGDFNNDGKPDIVTGNHSAPTISILMATGTGSFDPAVSYTAATHATFPVVADFNGDGKEDIAVSIDNSSELLIFMNTGATGTGTFADAATVPVTAASSNALPFQTTVGDFNGDNIPDIVAADYNYSGVSFFPGVGDGTFGTELDKSVAGSPYGIASADLNGDGNLDIVTANFLGAKISVLLGAGDGSFGTPTSYDAGTNPGQVVIADFDQDGIPDLAVTNYGSAQLGFYKGHGDGTFDVAVETTINGNPYMLAVGDVNGDGQNDLGVAEGTTSDLRVFLSSVPSVRITNTTTTAAEGGATGSYDVVLSTQPTTDVTVIVTPDANETVSTSSILFTSMDWNIARTVTVAAVDDSIAQGTHTGTIAHTIAPGSDSDYAGLSVSSTLVTITDNDTAGFIFSTTSIATTEGSTTSSYDVSLTSQPTSTIRLTVSPDSGSTVSTSTIVFTDLNWNVPVTVTVTAVNDSVAQGTHVSTITHSATSTSTGYNNPMIASVTNTITDNDTAHVTISPTSVSVTEGGATSSYSVILDSQPTSTVTVTVTPDASETVSTSSIDFDATNWNIPVTVSVAAVDDSVAQGTHTGTITHSVSSDSTGYNGATVSSTTVTVTDNDTAGVTISKTSVAVTEGGATDSYTAVLTSEPTSTVTLVVSTSGLFTVSTSSIAFDASNWSIPTTIVVTATDDSTVQGTHTGTITHAVSSSSTGYNGTTVSSTIVTITDNDTNPAPNTTDNGGGGAGAAASAGAALPPPVTTYQIFDSKTGTYITQSNPPTTPTIPPPVILPTPPPSIGGLQNPSDLPFLLQNLGLTRDQVAEDLVLKQVYADAKEFGMIITASQAATIKNFIVYGISPATIKFGQGERRAIMRDYMETVRRSDVVWTDIERLATGQIPLTRNLALERLQVGTAQPVFRQIFGHDPNFKNATENLAWNALLYRIRFPRDLVKERNGTLAFFSIYKHNPTTPFGWSVVRVLGYVK